MCFVSGTKGRERETEGGREKGSHVDNFFALELTTAPWGTIPSGALFILFLTRFYEISGDSFFVGFIASFVGFRGCRLMSVIQESYQTISGTKNQKISHISSAI